MTNTNILGSLDTMLDQLGGRDAGKVPKICHRVPGLRCYLPSVYSWSQKDMVSFHAGVYEDRNRSGIYVAGSNNWQYILEDHPEIHYFASVGNPIDEGELKVIEAIRGNNHMTTHEFLIDDWNRRTDMTFDPPSEENVRPLVSLLKEWHAA
ncbi:MAG: hypothetical protein OXH90_02850 [Paracoccaceae bacterium]|nr:hypothetical protein [Paracoccaceae bacterium]MDE2916524.1 hypothetical protein [Paracoccaceae bacterium]